jgi:hypothetical protein
MSVAIPLVTRFGVPASGSYTEIADFIRKNGLEAAKKEYVSCLLNESVIGPDGLTDSGITIMWNVLIGDNAVVFSNANCRLGVSTDTTGFSASTQSNLNPSGSATYFMQAIDATFPKVSGQQCSWEATFDGNTANFVWNSFGVDNDAVDGVGTTITSYDTTRGLLNRFVSFQGIKPLGQTWILTLVIEQT